MKDIYRAISASITGRYTVYAANLLSTMILARIFQPSTFGTIGLLLVITVVFHMLIEGGLSPSIINLKTLPPTERDGAYTSLVACGLTISITLLFAKGPIESFYKTSFSQELIWAVSIVLLANTCAAFPGALLSREKRFGPIAIAGLAAEVISTTVAISLANRTEEVTALSAKTLSASIVNLCILLYFSRATEFGMPKLGRKILSIAPILRVSGYQFGFNIFNFLSRNLDNVLVGKELGSTSLGLYEKSYQLMRYPLLLLSFAINPAIQPALKQYANDPVYLEHAHRKIVRLLAAVSIPIASLFYFGSTQIVTILLGTNWASVAPILCALSVSIPLQVMLATSGGFFLSANRSDVMFISGLLSSTTTIIAIVVGVSFGDMQMLALLISASIFANFFQAYALLYKYVFKQSPHNFFITSIPILLLSSSLMIHQVVLMQYNTQ